MQLRWSHAFVHVRDVAIMVAFYTEVLGFEVTDRGAVGGRPVVFLSQVATDHHQLAFLGPAADAAANPAAALRWRRCWRTKRTWNGLGSGRTDDGLREPGRVAAARQRHAERPRLASGVRS